jgi:hypothetical protein
MKMGLLLRKQQCVLELRIGSALVLITDNDAETLGTTKERFDQAEGLTSHNVCTSLQYTSLYVSFTLFLFLSNGFWSFCSRLLRHAGTTRNLAGEYHQWACFYTS